MSSSFFDESDHASFKVQDPTKLSFSSNKQQFHPAFVVNNIKNNILFTLKMEKDHYTMWDELFEVHARAHKMVHHIIL